MPISEELLALWLKYFPEHSNAEIPTHPAINTDKELMMSLVSNGLF